MLLRKRTKWSWTEERTEAFKVSIELIDSAPAIVRHNREEPVVLIRDASTCSLGAVLGQHDADGKERTIAFGSRRLPPAVQNYSKIDEQARASVYGVEGSHEYL